MRRFPRAEVHRLEHAGHWLLEDEPEEALAIVRGFLERTPLALSR
jgi:pimeloyl-ACP methyl ester carboxylesterase